MVTPAPGAGLVELHTGPASNRFTCEDKGDTLPSRASCTSAVVHSIAIIMELIRKNNSDYFKPYLFHSLRNRLIQAILEAYLQALVNLPVKNNNGVIAFFTSDIGPVLEYYDCDGGAHLGSITWISTFALTARHRLSCGRHVSVREKRGQIANETSLRLSDLTSQVKEDSVEPVVSHNNGSNGSKCPRATRSIFDKLDISIFGKLNISMLNGSRWSIVKDAPNTVSMSFGTTAFSPFIAVVRHPTIILHTDTSDAESVSVKRSGAPSTLSAVIKNVKHSFNMEGDIDLVGFDKYWDPHAITGLLKSFLRELPASILTHKLHLRFLLVIDFVDPQERIRELS
ncbi:hypothetical protein B0H14DRAFT_3423059 [Mycena olivaceomarginata]|nr:hypothetical protein B0H14DRAFT_3423059 [Mycena olivaceomarginata]